MSVIILCARQGEGKTSFLRDVLSEAAEQGRRVGGLILPAVFEDGRRVGYDVVDVRNGRRWALARRIGQRDATVSERCLIPQLAIGSYEFDSPAIVRGVEAIIGSVRDRLDLVAIDEIGPLEFRGEAWAPALKFALEQQEPAQTLIITVRPSLANDLVDRFPSSRWATARRIDPPWPPVRASRPLNPSTPEPPLVPPSAEDDRGEVQKLE